MSDNDESPEEYQPDSPGQVGEEPDIERPDVQADDSEEEDISSFSLKMKWVSKQSMKIVKHLSNG